MSENTEEKTMTPRRQRRVFKKTQWWACHETGESPHGMVTSAVQEMRTQQQWRRDAYRRWARAYGEHLEGFGGEPFAEDENQLSINFLANTIDTLHADVYKTRTLPMPMTTAGDYLMFKRAQRLGRFFEGIFDEVRFFSDLQLQLGLFVLITGTGWLKGYRSNGRICASVIPSWDIYIDETEARYGKPRTLYQRMLMDRYVLLEEYGYEPEEEDPSLYSSADERFDAIVNTTHTSSDDEAFDTDYNGDQIIVTEAWHLPSGPKACDGRHVICIDRGTLVDEPWKRDSFPFRSLKGGVTLTGVNGPSAVARILPAQREHDRLSTKIQGAHELLGVPRILVPENGEIVLDHINNSIGGLLKVKGGIGNKPQEWNAEPIHPQTYQYRSSLREEMGAELGVSPFASQSQLPVGMQNASGKAIQLVGENDSGRNAVRHRLLEQFVLDVADLFIEEAEALSEDDDDFAVLVAGRRSADELKWKDVRIDRKKLKMKISPASALSKTPGAKFDQLMKLREAGEISSEEFRYMFEMPDLEKLNGVAVSDLESIDKKIEAMVFENEYRDPSPFDNLQLAIKRGSQLYNYFDLEGTPDDRLALIRQFVDRAVQLSTPPTPTPSPTPTPTPSLEVETPIDPMAAAPPMATGTA